MIELTLTEARNRLPELAATDVRDGDVVYLTRYGRRVAALVPVDVAEDHERMEDEHLSSLADEAKADTDPALSTAELVKERAGPAGGRDAMKDASLTLSVTKASFIAFRPDHRATGLGRTEYAPTWELRQQVGTAKGVQRRHAVLLESLTRFGWSAPRSGSGLPACWWSGPRSGRGSNRRSRSPARRR